MKVSILGTGTSTGVPVPGCPCAVCTSSDPRNSRLRTSAVIRFQNGPTILLDAGPDLRQQALRSQLTAVDAVLYTHAHADHILGTDDLRVFNFKRKDPIPCYGKQETLSALKKSFHYIFEPNPGYQGGLIAKLSLHTVEPETPFEVEGITVTPFQLFHGSLEVLGFRIGNFVYATDCNRIPEASKAIMQDAEVLILDGLRYNTHATHFTIPQAVETAQALNARHTYLIHMTHDVDYEKGNAQLPDGISLAYDGLELNVSS